MENNIITHKNVISSKKLITLLTIFIIAILLITAVAFYSKKYHHYLELEKKVDELSAEFSTLHDNKTLFRDEGHKTDPLEKSKITTSNENLLFLIKLYQFQASLKKGETLTPLYLEKIQDSHLSQIIIEINTLITSEQNYLPFKDNLRFLKRELETKITQEKLVTLGLSNKTALYIAKLFNYRNLKKSQTNLNNLEGNLTKLESAIDLHQYDLALTLLNYLPEIETMENSKINVTKYLQLSLLLNQAINYLMNEQVQE